MNKRQIKFSCYLEQLNIEVVKVEMILNQLNRLKNNQEIANYIIERDLLKTKCQLELSLASLCIILRKMCENQFITLNQEEKILIVLSIQIVLIFLRTIKFMFFHKKDKKKSISFNY